MNLSVCGIDCDLCKHREEDGCLGCSVTKGKQFWGNCDLYACCNRKNLPHCGKCEGFPCKMLKEWAAQANPERIQNLIDLNKKPTNL